VIHHNILASGKNVESQAGTVRGWRAAVLACLICGLLDDTDFSFNVSHHAARKLSIHGEAFLEPESFVAVHSAQCGHMSGQRLGSFAMVTHGAQGRGILPAGTVCGRQNRARDAVGLDLCLSKALRSTDAAPRDKRSMGAFRHCGQSQLQASLAPGLSQPTEGLMPAERRSGAQSTSRALLKVLNPGGAGLGTSGEGGAHLILFSQVGCWLFFSNGSKGPKGLQVQAARTFDFKSQLILATMGSAYFTLGLLLCLAPHLPARTSLHASPPTANLPLWHATPRASLGHPAGHRQILARGGVAKGRSTYGCARLSGGGEDEEEPTMDEEWAKAMALLNKSEKAFQAAGVRPSGAALPEAAQSRLNSLQGLKGALGTTADDLEDDDAKYELMKQFRMVDDDTARNAFSESIDGGSVNWESAVDREKRTSAHMIKAMKEGGGRPGPKGSFWDKFPDLGKKALSLPCDPHYPLWKAVADGNADRLRYLLEHPPFPINYRFEALWNSTLLHVASERPSVEVVTLLVQAGALVEDLNGHEQAPLHLASFNGRIGIVERLLEMGAHIEGRSTDHSTPLHVAAFNGQNETAKQLVRLGASLTSVNEAKENALALAEMGRWRELATWLRAQMGMPPKPDEVEQAELENYQEVKDAAEKKLSEKLLKTLDPTKVRAGMVRPGEEGPSAPADVDNSADLLARVKKSVEVTAHAEAISHLRMGAS